MNNSYYNFPFSDSGVPTREGTIFLGETNSNYAGGCNYLDAFFLREWFLLSLVPNLLYILDGGFHFLTIESILKSFSSSPSENVWVFGDEKFLWEKDLDFWYFYFYIFYFLSVR